MFRTKHKKNRPSSPILESLMHAIAAEHGEMKMVINDAGGHTSISDAIHAIIAPYSKAANDYDSFYRLVLLACAAWNACILPAGESESMIENMRAVLDTDDYQRQRDFTDTINTLMARKRLLFPAVSSLIIKFKVTKRSNDFLLAVASMPITPERNKKPAVLDAGTP